MRHNKIISILLVVLILISSAFNGKFIKKVYALDEKWIYISDATDLNNIRNNLSGKYRLVSDIDLTNVSIDPIGSSSDPFTGILDGNSKVIRNFSINNTSTVNNGLFSVIGATGEIKNLSIEGVNITSGDYTGALAGINKGKIERSYVKGSVTGKDYVGGLVGSNEGQVLNSFSSAFVSGKDYLGGLIGSSTGTVDKSYSSSKVESSLFNNYLQFNGTDGYIEIPHIPNYATDKFTLEAWFQWDKVGTNEVNFIISKGAPGSGVAPEEFEIHTGGNSGKNGIRFIPIPAVNSDSYLDVKEAVQTGWFHVAAVYDFTTDSARVYINGVQQDLYNDLNISGTLLGKTATLSRDTNPLSDNTYSFNIGRRSDNTFYFNGKICDVRFWNIARTSEQINADKNKKLSGSEPGLIGYWKLTEESGTEAFDSTANGNKGTLIGGVTRVTETATTNKGGLVGYNTGTVSNSYYDSEVSGQNDTGKGEPKTSTEMKDVNTFNTSWDFSSIWGIGGGTNDGYPYLFPVALEPTINIQPQDTTVNAGNKGAFTINASVSDGGVLSYKWQKSTDGGTTWNDILGAINNNYTTETLLTTDNSTKYRCIVTNTKNSTARDTVSEVATLTVNGSNAGVPFTVGNSIHFADANDSIRTGAPLTTNIDNITMETWVKADTLSTAPYTRIMYNGNSGPNGYGIYLAGPDKSVCILLGSVGFIGPTVPVNLSTGQWYHLAIVRDNGIWKLYVNGENKPISVNSNLTPHIPTTEFSIGNSSFSLENFTGAIDEVRFWTVARTEQEIKDNMYIKLAGSEAGLLAYYNFEQGVAGGDNTAISTITDLAGGDQNLTISGFTLNGPTSNFVQSVQLGSFQFENTNYTVKENKGSVRVAITRTGGSEGAATINYSTSDGTAIAGTNYTSVSGSITFSSGEVRKEIDIPIINNNIDSIKNFTMTLSAQQGITINSSSTTINIDKNDEKSISTFNFDGLSPVVTGVIDENAKTVILNVPYSTDLTNLVPTITHTGASIAPNTGVGNDFTNPVTYTVTAKDGSTQNYIVTVIKPSLSSIEITSPATKLSYKIGEALDISGLVVTGSYSDGTTKVETVTAENITGFNSTAVAASQTLTINVGGKTTTYTVEVVKADGPALTGVSINDAENTISGLTSAMEFSTDGIDYTTYNEETPNLPDLTGNVELRVRVKATATHTAGAVTSFNFTIPTLSSIAITTPATKLSYKIGEAIDISGLVVTGTYSDGTTKVETVTAENITGFNSTAVAASQSLTISVGGKTTTYTVAIEKADGPALTGVSINDATNTISGLTSAMEFSTDGTTWTAYNEGTPNLPDLTGNVELRVRVAETATHTAGAATSFNFTIPTLSSIAITSPATKLSYKVGEALDISGLVVTGSYSDGTTKVETVTAENITGFNSTAVAASQTLTITIGGKTTTYTVVIKNIIQEVYIPSEIQDTNNKTSEEITVPITDDSESKNISETIIIRKTEGDGTKKDEVKYTADKARETVEKLKNQNIDTARIVIPDEKDEIAETKVEIPTATLNIIGPSNINLEISTESARIIMPSETIQDLSKGNVTKTGEELFFRVVPIKDDEKKDEILKRAQQESVVKEAVDRTVTDNSNTTSNLLGISVVGRPMEIETNMTQRPVDIVLPLKDINIPKDKGEMEAFLNNLAVFIEHSDGDKEVVKGEIVDYKNGILGIKFRITKFSTFTIIKVNEKDNHIKSGNDKFGGIKTFLQDKELKITFNKELYEASVIKENIYVEDSKGNIHDTLLIYDKVNKSVSVIPKEYYKPQETYKLIVRKDVLSNSSESLGDTIIYSFNIGNVILNKQQK